MIGANYEDDKIEAPNGTKSNRRQHYLLSSRSHARGSENGYSLTLRLRYETEFGQELFVIGSIPELGQWKKPKFKLIWSEDHIWETETPILTDQSYFSYKYVLVNNGQLVKWEDGFDRIADLDLLPEVAHRETGIRKDVEINDEWEKFKIIFSVNFPPDDPNQIVSVSGETEILGSWGKTKDDSL